VNWTRTLAQFVIFCAVLSVLLSTAPFFGVASAQAPDSIVAANTTTTAGTNATITVTAIDANNNPLTNESIVITSAGGLSDLAGINSTTNSTGIATFSFNETTVDNYTVAFSDAGGNITDTATVTVGAAGEAGVEEKKASWSLQVNGTTQTGTYAGNGSTSDPYVIDSLVDLQAVDKNSTTRSYAYELGTNLDASATRTWNRGNGFNPINSFSGTFDGNGHDISDLSINRSGTSSVGLFGRIEPDGSISNVHLDNVSVVGRNNVGALVGYSSGQIDGSSAAGTVTGSTRVGGLIGEVGSTTVSNSYADVEVEGGSQVGGFVGELTMGGGEITGSFARGNVSGSGNVGGFVGQAGDYVAYADAAFGRVVRAQRAARLGCPGDPFTGENRNKKYVVSHLIGGQVSISNSYASGNVSGGRGGFVGIVGEASISVVRIRRNDIKILREICG